MLKHFIETSEGLIELEEASPEFIKMAQGPAILADEKALSKDKQGLTHPNLHRRIKTNTTIGEEDLPVDYGLSIQGVDSYRSTIILSHDEESTTRETP